MPGYCPKVLIEVIHLSLVHFHESFISQLSASLDESALGYKPHGYFGAFQQLEKLVQFILQSAFDQVEQEDHHNDKRQTTCTREILWILTVTLLETFRKEQGSETFEKPQRCCCATLFHDKNQPPFSTYFANRIIVFPICSRCKSLSY